MSKKLLKRLVHESYALGAVGDQYALHHARKDGAKAESLVRDLLVELLEKVGNFLHLAGGFTKNAKRRCEKNRAKVTIRQPANDFAQLSERTYNTEVETGDQRQNESGRGNLPEAQSSGTAWKRYPSPRTVSSRLAWALSFFPQAAHVGVHSTRVDGVLVAPNVEKQLFARLRAPAALDENGQKLEFRRGQVEALAVEADLEGVLVDGKGIEFDEVAFAAGTQPAEKRLDAEHEFARAEWLGDVIVGTEFETLCTRSAGSLFAVSITIGRPSVSGSLFNALQSSCPVELGKHQVQDDHIWTGFACHLEPLYAVAGDQNSETGPVQVIPEQVDNIGFIFNNQDSILHGHWALPKLAQNLQAPLREKFEAKKDSGHQRCCSEKQRKTEPRWPE